MSLGNAGNVTLTTVTVDDPLPGLVAMDCGTPLPATLAPGAALDCTATQSTGHGYQHRQQSTAGTDQAGPVDSTVTLDVVP